MNAKPLLVCFFSACTAFAADPLTPPSQYHATKIQPLPFSDPARWSNLLTEKHESALITLGKSDFAISGPLVEGFRRLPPEQNLSLGRKFLRLPVIRLFVPGPMERPPGGTGRYFAWRNSDLAWPDAASRPPIMKGAITFPH
jgi:hypothetical protein